MFRTTNKNDRFSHERLNKSMAHLGFIYLNTLRSSLALVKNHIESVEFGHETKSCEIRIESASFFFRVLGRWTQRIWINQAETGSDSATHSQGNRSFASVVSTICYMSKPKRKLKKKVFVFLSEIFFHQIRRPKTLENGSKREIESSRKSSNFEKIWSTEWNKSLKKKLIFCKTNRKFFKFDRSFSSNQFSWISSGSNSN